jgi:hypothetical protein
VTRCAREAEGNARAEASPQRFRSVGRSSQHCGEQ